jgi:alkylation response protein AidB-like acyl-CoA dehydrogenase
MIGASQAGIAGAWLTDEAIDSVFGRRRAALVAGGLVPRGRARPVDGGFQLSGRWGFGSGCRHADWMMLAAIAPGAPEGAADPINPLIPPGSEMRVFVLPVGEVEIHDNWQVAGLKATASCDYSVEDAFVPDALSFRFFDKPRRGGALFRLPGQTFVAAGHAGVALGVARRALDELTALAGRKLRLAASAELSGSGAFQQELAHAEARLRGARLLVQDALGSAWSSVCARRSLDLAQRASVSLGAAHANRVAREVSSFAFRAAGAEALYLGSPIQRAWRDACAAGQHFAVNDQIFERVGQTLLGVAPPGVLL